MVIPSGTNCPTSPPFLMMSRTMEELTDAYSGAHRKNTVSISGCISLFIWPMLRSNSKSADVRSPRRIKPAFSLRQKSMVIPVYVAIMIPGSRPKIWCSHSSLRSSGKKDRFSPFSPIATIILSKSGSALLMIDSCPRVMGSKEPGKTAILSIQISLNQQR